MTEVPNPLSEREQEILSLVATGATNQQIARELCISINTVKVHLRNVFSKLEVESRTEATMWAVQQGLVVVSNHRQEETDQLQPDEDTDIPVESPAPLPKLPLPLWKRLFFITSAAVLFTLALLPPLLHSSSREAMSPPNVFTDQDISKEDNSLAPTSRWSSRARMLSPRARLAAAAFDGWVYTIGGDTGDGVSSEVEAYDPHSNTWQLGRPKPTAVSNIGAVTVDNLIYVPGGILSNGQVTDVLEAYAPTGDEWITLSSLPRPVCAYAIAAMEGKVYLFGGWDGESYLDTVHIYDTATDTWSAGTPMPTPRAFAGAAALRDRIYVVGGYDEKQEFAVCQEYNPHGEGGNRSPWRERRSMSLPRGGLAVATVGDSVFAIGGGWQNYLAYNERYDPRSDTWFSFESPIIGQWRNLGLTAIDVSLYAIGGWSGEYLNTNEEYQALYRIILPMRHP